MVKVVVFVRVCSFTGHHLQVALKSFNINFVPRGNINCP